MLINLYVAAESLNSSHRDFTEETQEEDLELPLFDLETVSAATDKFSFKNKIGQGGFGPVYKVIFHERRHLKHKISNWGT